MLTRRPARRSPSRSTPTRPRVAKNLILVITGLLAGAALYISVLILQTQHVLGGLTRYNATWLMSQAATDVARLEAATGKYGLTGDEADADEVQLRYEILLNRIGLLANGEVRDLIGKSPQMQQLAAQMKAAVAEASGPVERIARPGSAAALVGAIDPLNAAVAQLATAAYTESGEAAGRDLRHLDELHWIFSGVLAGLIACCLSLVGILRWHNRMLRTAHNEVQDLVSGLQQASMELVVANQQIQDAMQEAQTQNRVLRERDIELHHQNARFTAALDNMSQGLCMVDAEGDLIVCNARFLELFRLRADEAVSGRAIRDLFRMARRNGVFDTSVIRAIETEQQQLAEDRNGGSFFKEDGDGNAIAVSHRPMLDGGWVATYEDITERRRVDAKISFIARHDPLTQLANRFHFQEQMERALQFRRRRGDKVAVLLLDLDNFKDVNDTLGHPVGDMLLKSVSDRLRACLRETDVIGRLGGDEFAILHVDANQPEGAAALARNMVEVLCEPFELDGRQVFVGVSVGIAIAQDDDDDASRLLKNADVALYRAKAEGRGTWRVFEAAMEVEVELRLSTGADLREALSRNELEIYYQPLFGLDENRVTGYEALLRWHHPQRGLISPVQFIPIAEELGLIIPIGEWLLEQACKDATTWPDDVKIAVNLSPIQIRSGDIVASVKRALAASGLAAARLELEITESALLQDSQKVVDTLHALRRLGLRTALDDFGTGYSSLSYLRSFPFDKIKIDQVFVREIGQRSDCLAIVNSIARLAGDLGMTTTAEGVETEAQLHFLRHAGCEEVQGFLFGRPRPLGMIERTMPVLPALTAA